MTQLLHVIQYDFVYHYKPTSINMNPVLLMFFISKTTWLHDFIDNVVLIYQKVYQQ